MQRKVFCEYVSWHLSNNQPERSDYPKPDTDLFTEGWLDRDNLTDFVYYLEDLTGEELVFQGFNWRDLHTPEKIWDKLNITFFCATGGKNGVRSTLFG